MRQAASPDAVIGILLAAGKGARFDPSGRQSKLLQPLPDGQLVASAAAKNLLAALPAVLAVVRPGSDRLQSALRSLGCAVTLCPNADDGMAASLVHALSNAPPAQGWVIALADMPFVQPHTIRALADAIQRGAHIAAPSFLGRRGNPVAFGKACFDDLLRLRGDEGARRLLGMYPVEEIAVNDPGVLRDIDTALDLHIKP